MANDVGTEAALALIMPEWPQPFLIHEPADAVRFGRSLLLETGWIAVQEPESISGFVNQSRARELTAGPLTIRCDPAVYPKAQGSGPPNRASARPSHRCRHRSVRAAGTW